MRKIIQSFMAVSAFFLIMAGVQGKSASAQVTEQWAKHYKNTTSSYDYPTDMAVNAAGEVVVTGYSRNYSYRSKRYYQDMMTVKYDKDGNQIWANTYNSPRNSYDNATGTAIDDAGNVYVTGYSANASGTGTGYDYATLKYGSGWHTPVESILYQLGKFI